MRLDARRFRICFTVPCLPSFLQIVFICVRKHRDDVRGTVDTLVQRAGYCVEWCLRLAAVARVYGGKVSVATG